MLSTVITANLLAPRVAQRALVLMGGGARTAYQVGVLSTVGRLLANDQNDLAPKAQDWPFSLLVGTSAGALNSAFLASHAHEGLAAFDALSGFWRGLRSQRVYTLNVPPWMRVHRWLTALGLSHRAASLGAVLDNMQLIDSLHQAISLNAIERNLHQRVLNVLAVTASSYTTGLHWTFCQTAATANMPPAATQARAGRRLHHEPITIDHLAASSAIPLIFPAASLYVDGRREFFGDGSMRQVSPLSAPMKLGATHVLAIGVGQPDRRGLGAADAVPTLPSLGLVAGHAMASVFHDTLRADVEQAQRVNATLQSLPPDLREGLGYKPVQVLHISPSQSLDAMAVSHLAHLPQGVRHVLTGLGAKGSAGAALASYLLFEPAFIQALMRLGEHDAMAHKAELLAFFCA